MGEQLAIVTGSGGLVGSSTVRALIERGWRVVGIDNDMRRRFFGDEASTAETTRWLANRYRAFKPEHADIRDPARIDWLFRLYRPSLVVHCAAQPAHDWAAKDPQTDFFVNAVGTLNMLEATRENARDAPFIHCSTSKVYGDNPNFLPLVEHERYLWPEKGSRYFDGIDTSMSIDQCTHSLFGASKASGDLLVQEYGRYFNMPTVCFRPGCITGPQHMGAELHGFLAYLVKCHLEGKQYTVIGYGGKQVRCNIHADDLARAFLAYADSPRPGAVYNIGGGPRGTCSVIEAMQVLEEATGRPVNYTYREEARIGDHKWWVSDNRPFEADYGWEPEYDIQETIAELCGPVY